MMYVFMLFAIIVIFTEHIHGFSLNDLKRSKHENLSSPQSKVLPPPTNTQANILSSDSSTILSRRAIFSSLLVGTACIQSSKSCQAATVDNNNVIWLTGKEPIIPGKKPRDKNDVSGTKKDPKFLRSISDCKNQCENAVGRDGYARSKEECLSDCQDICCTTYQQCTFGIVNRI